MNRTRLLAPVLLVCVARAAPQDATMKAVVGAANAPDRAAAQRLALPGRAGAFSWIPEKGSGMIRRVFQPEPWKAASLPAAFSNDGRPLAVFHTWHAPESDGDHIYPLASTKAGWRFDAEVPETDTQGYRITHHEIRIRLIPSAKRVEATDTVTVRRAAGAKRVAFVRFSDDFTVSSVRSGARGVPFRQAGGVVAVRMPAGAQARLTFTYAGRVDHRLLSGFAPDVAALTSYHYPSLGRLPASADTTVIVPRGWTAVTQGELAARTDRAGETLFRYHNPLPVNYFSLVAGRFTETKRKAGRVTLYTYLTKSQPGFAGSLLDALAMALPYFEKRFGPYPYTRYSIVDGGPILGFVALEGYSMASYGTMTLTPMVVSHELSHTWWGGVVPNTYLRSWWNEAFASYSDDAVSRWKNGVTAPHPTDKPWWPALSDAEEAPLSTARDVEAINAIAYGKGKDVLRMLEWKLGTPTFDRCLREFIRANRSAPDPNWPDFERAVRQVTGQDYGWFFRQWVDRAGYPALRLADVKAEEASGQWQVTGRIVQDGPPYRLDVHLRLAGVPNEPGVPIGSPRDTVVSVDSSSTPFRIVSPVKPERLQLDPDLDFPREMGLDDVAVFADGVTTLKHSHEEPGPSPFGGM